MKNNRLATDSLCEESAEIRMRQLESLAEDGDENAVGDLWLEFGVRFEEVMT